MSLRVYCRIRDGTYDHIEQNNDSCSIRITCKKTNHNFVVNKLWNKAESNAVIFNELYLNAADHQVNYWVAFGYTGSGKTYTTTNLIKELYSTLSIDKKSKLFISAIQIYNDNIYDLLNQNKSLVFYKTDDLVINDVVKRNDDNIDNLITMMMQNRNTAHTEMNNTSSRSHAIITIYYNKKKYIIVDMAGQEAISNTNKDPEIQRQSNCINLNMLALKECIRNHNNKESYIPYRRTLLTLALKPIFENKCNVSFICNINLKQQLYYQIDSLRYAASLYRKESNKPDPAIVLFKRYMSYVENIGMYLCEERLLCNELKNGNFDNVKQIGELMLKKKKCIKKMIEIYSAYEKKYT